MEHPQPQPGDVVVGCRHRPKPSGAHIFKLLVKFTFTRADGTKSDAQWIFLCDRCFEKHVASGGRATDAPLACDFVWKESHGKLNFGKSS